MRGRLQGDVDKLNLRLRIGQPQGMPPPLSGCWFRGLFAAVSPGPAGPSRVRGAAPGGSCLLATLLMFIASASDSLERGWRPQRGCAHPGPSKTVEFDFDLGADTAMSVASEMVEDLSLSHEDAQVSQASCACSCLILHM